MKNYSFYTQLKCGLTGLFIFLTLCVFAADETAPSVRSGKTGLHSYVSSSVLSEGKWIKIRVKETGIYKITYEELVKMGFSNPANVQLYGYGGWILDENFLLPKIDDLPQLSVWVEKGTDNVFNAGDYILFYAKGTVKWTLNAGKFIHLNNPYSNYGYYFITENTAPTRQMSVTPALNSYSQEITTFDDYSVHEKDLVSISHTGREFYGEDFSFNLSQNFTFDTPGITQNEGHVYISFVSKATSSTLVTAKINGGNTISSPVGIPTSSYENAKETIIQGGWDETKNETNTVNIAYGSAGHSNVRLNFIRLNYMRSLRPYSAATFFRSKAAIGRASRYTLANAGANVLVWDVTDGTNVRQMETHTSGSNLYISAQSSGLQEFVAVDISKNSQLPSPEVVGEIPVQNLHALPQTDLVVLTHPDFKEEANRIAEMHRTVDGLRAHVVTTEEAYNEFSSGTPDASAYRWLMKMFYDRGMASGKDGELPKYLLLFGAGSFDNRLLSPEWKLEVPSNKVLTFQTVNSLVETSSYVIDDYFGFLDDDEGVTLNSNRVDIGIGRFPVRTLQEAKNVTDKTINYVMNPIYGPWKSNVCFVADDMSGQEKAPIHMTQADELTTSFLEKGSREFIVNKIYLQTFQRQTSASGYTYPDATKKLQNLLKSGLLMVNYTGHGSTTRWAEEGIYTIHDADNLHISRLPLFVTATCDFTRFDGFGLSAGEVVFLNPTGGGIALFSTTRIVYSQNNFNINKEFCRNIFSRTSDGRRLRLGDILRLSKRSDNLWGDSNKLSFTLIGDPALTLAYPEYHAQ
ncbi:MAG: type IX secretion system sortase PorU, partial [Bacteroidales bacterium]|nr:type IX secretion system sortase PorU [Bacteroidales bacterium]